MEGIIEALHRFAIERPNQIALLGEEWEKDDAEGHQPCQLSYARLLAEVERAEQQIISSGCKRIALRAENGFDWVIADLASMKANITLVPVPMFFSAAQVKHLLASARIDAVCGDWQGVLDDGNHKENPISRIAGLPLYQYCSEQEAVHDLALPAQTAKITFTSGSTGQPKGVCLSQTHLEQVANVLSASLLASGTDIERHMVLLPLSTLLENVTGLYIPLLLGATSVIVRGEALGLTGSSQFKGAVFAQALAKYQPQSLVVTPALLTALVRIAGQAPGLIQSLRFVAVGGAKVSPALLQQAHQSGIPAYEGYGLSECGSVVSLNLPGAMKPGSCGRVLPHCEISIADDGEVMVAGSAMLGYAGETCTAEVIATGDLGYIDNEQFLHITGRKKNQLITAYGRNISPEWIESETQTIAGLEQFVVLGEGKDALAAVVFSSRPDLIEAGIERLNAGLPDYARIQHVVVSPDPLLSIPGLMTSNGRPRRDAIADYFHNELFEKENVMSQSPSFFNVLKQQTADAQSYMYSAPVFEACAQGQITMQTYTAFLTQAYHHVKHTVPLLMGCGSRLPEQYEWLRQALAEYIEEEKGHHEWILDDIRACQADADSVKHNQGEGRMCAPIELMVAYLYHQIDRRNPMAFFGMVWVLEGTSVNVGGQMAKMIQSTLGLPDKAMVYLTSHSTLDQEHIKLFEGLMNKIDDPVDQQAVIDGANMVFRLYGEMLHSLSQPVHARSANAA